MNDLSKITAAGLGTTSDYYIRRARQERALVARSTDPVARRVHAELAERYSVLIGEPA